MLGSYPTWPYRKCLGLARDTRYYASPWNVTLADALAAQGNSDIHFFTLAAGINRTREVRRKSGLLVHFVKMDRLWKAVDLATAYRLSRARLVTELARWEPDVVHGIGTEHPYADVAVRTRTAHVITIHGIARAIKSWARGVTKVRLSLAAIWEASTLCAARDVIVISPYIGRVIRASFSTSGARQHFIENPVTPEFFETPLVPRMRREGILFVGGIQPWKGLDVLLEAMRRIPAGRRPFLRIIGSVPPGQTRYASTLRRQANRDGLGPYLEWLGPRGRESVLRYMASAALLIVPSRQETAPMVISEAVALGTPVIAADVGGITYMIPGDGEGLVVPPQDPGALAWTIQKAVSGHKWTEPEVMRESALRRFAPDAVATRTFQVYRKALECAACH